MNARSMKTQSVKIPGEIPAEIEATPYAPARQKGATLITALVMLVVLTLLVISAIRSSTVNLQITGNVQIQNEAIAAAQQATEQIISSNFTVNPVSAVIPIYVTSNPTPDYSAQVAVPTCSGSRPLYNNTPNLPPQCLSSSSAGNTGIVYVNTAASGVQQTGQSWCFAQQWEVQTNITDQRTGAQAEIHQGVSLYVPVGTSC